MWAEDRADCCVTGSNNGILSDPKFSLKRIIEVVVFPKVKILVQKEGELENDQVIFQEDGARPHI